MCSSQDLELEKDARLRTDSVTVITLTRRRPHLLMRAITSVSAQDCTVPLTHFVLVDDCTETQKMLAQSDDLPSNLVWRFMPRSSKDRSGPGRSGEIRNAGVTMVNSTWVSFLDDDNELEPCHIRALLECAQKADVQAVHSWLKMYHRDGTPFLEELDPWTQNEKKSRQVYRWMAAKGVRSPSSNVFRDRADPLGTEDPVRSVDTGEWLLSRHLLEKIPFRESFSAQDWREMIGEDDKLLADLIANNVKIACTRKASLHYYLGGYSNTRVLL